MAVVAFPFTCFTSDDIDDLDSLHPYATSRDQTQKAVGPRPRLNDDEQPALASSGLSLDSSGGPATPDLPDTEYRPNGDNIDEMFDEALEGDADGSDESDNSKEEMLQETAPQSDRAVEEGDGGERSGNSTEESKQEAEEQCDEDGNEGGGNNMVEAHLQTNTLVSEESRSSAVEGYGGLSNLGNTCFMNAALQMVASLDGFTKDLETTTAPESHQPNLRLVFLDTMASLAEGKTVSPTEFKQALDERTSLFLGYHQEDSHEFLTKFLDLIDADYVIATEVPKGNNSSMDTEGTSDANDDENDSDQPTAMEACGQEETTPMLEVEGDTEANNDEITDVVEGNLDDQSHEQKLPQRERLESYESAAKKARNLEECEETQQLGDNALSIARSRGGSKSFSDLQPDGIEELLNARILVDNTHEITTAPSPLRCKLAGGRMASSEHNSAALICEPDASATPSKEAQCEEEEDAAIAHLSPVNKYFQTEVRVRLTCASCKFTRTHQENFIHLSLEICADSDGVSGNVEDGLRKFFSPETREIKCEKCFCASALQTMEITRLPRALLLHFKRFIVDVSDDYTSITYRKNQSDVLFDNRLDFKSVLSEFVADDFAFPEGFENLHCEHEAGRSYDIRSIVNHIGASAACGHYTADSLRVYPGGDRRWNRFNDSYVTSISSHDAIRDSSGTAYMVMYELSGSN